MSVKRSVKLGLCTVLISLLGVAVARPATADSLYSVDPWSSPVLWVIDPVDGSTIGGRFITEDSDDVYGTNGLAVDPTDGTMYALLELSSTSPGRSLVTLDPETAIATVIANLVYPFAAITFDDSGTLYGVTGSAQYMTANSRNALFTIDPSDGTLVQKCKITANSTNQGHALAFGDGLIYHAQQEGTDFYGDVILETVDPATDFPLVSTDLCTTSNVDVGEIPVHPQALLVTAEYDPGEVDLLMAGWNNYDNCCDTVLYGIETAGGSGTADLLGTLDDASKGLAFHTFDPDIFTDLPNLAVTKVSAKIRDGNERHLIYTIQVTNLGNSAVSDVTLFDYFDTSRLAYVSNDSGCSNTYSYQVSCNLGTFAAAQVKTINIDTIVTCKGKNCTSVSNSVQVSVPAIDEWLANPYNATTSWWGYNNTPLKGKW